MMKYWFVLVMFLFMLPGQGDAQENRNGFRLDTIYKSNARRSVTTQTPVKRDIPVKSSVAGQTGRWSLSGSFGMSFGDYTNIDVSPQVGYHWNEFLSAGGGVSYNYLHSSKNYDMNYLGLNIFGRVTPVKYIALQVQPEIKASWGKVYGRKIDLRYIPVMLVGGGCVFPTGTGFVSVMFYYDVIQDKYSPYRKNWVCSVGYSFNI